MHGSSSQVVYNAWGECHQPRRVTLDFLVNCQSYKLAEHQNITPLGYGTILRSTEHKSVDYLFELYTVFVLGAQSGKIQNPCPLGTHSLLVKTDTWACKNMAQNESVYHNWTSVKEDSSTNMDTFQGQQKFWTKSTELRKPPDVWWLVDISDSIAISAIDNTWERSSFAKSFCPLRIARNRSILSIRTMSGPRWKCSCYHWGTLLPSNKGPGKYMSTSSS